MAVRLASTAMDVVSSISRRADAAAAVRIALVFAGRLGRDLTWRTRMTSPPPSAPAMRLSV